MRGLADDWALGSAGRCDYRNICAAERKSEGHWEKNSIVLDLVPSASDVRAGPLKPVAQRRDQP